MTFDIALACVAGGGLMIAFAFAAIFFGPHARVNDAVKELTETAKKAQAADADKARASSAVIKDYFDGLSQLAGNLSKLTPPVAALVVATVLFGLGAALAAIDRIQA